MASSIREGKVNLILSRPRTGTLRNRMKTKIEFIVIKFPFSLRGLLCEQSIVVILIYPKTHALYVSLVTLTLTFSVLL